MSDEEGDSDPFVRGMTAAEIESEVRAILDKGNVRPTVRQAFLLTRRLPGQDGWQHMLEHPRNKYANALRCSVSEVPKHLLFRFEYDRMMRLLKKGQDVRGAAILSMMVSTGMDCGELSRLRLDDIDLEAGAIRVGGRRHAKDPGERYLNDCDDCRFIGAVGDNDAYYCQSGLGSEHGERFAVPLLVLVRPEGEKSENIVEELLPVAKAAQLVEGPLLQAFRLGTEKGLIPFDFEQRHAQAFIGEMFSEGGIEYIRRLCSNPVPEGFKTGELGEHLLKHANDEHYRMLTSTDLTSITNPSARAMFEGFILDTLYEPLKNVRPALLYAWRKTGKFPVQGKFERLSAESRYAVLRALEEWRELKFKEQQEFFKECERLVNNFHEAAADKS